MQKFQVRSRPTQITGSRGSKSRQGAKSFLIPGCITHVLHLKPTPSIPLLRYTGEISPDTNGRISWIKVEAGRKASVAVADSGLRATNVLGLALRALNKPCAQPGCLTTDFPDNLNFWIGINLQLKVWIATLYCVNIYKNVRPRKGLPVSRWCSDNTLLA
ncbi:hypothetical protein T492DRAFT_74821 [Pavlovales sp. CCMP2436]|nr:hypothetical protein T492DRAFT_74821 [Pavlovales sp. CCMP2436]